MIRKILVFCIGLIIIDYALGEAFRVMYFHSPHSEGPVLPPQTADVVILGSSRAKFHYDAKMISLLSGLNVVNLGEAGRGIFYAWLLQGIIFSKNIHPKLMIMDVLDTDFCYETVEPSGLEQFLIFADQDPALAKLLIRMDPTLRLKLLSRTYPFNSRFILVLKDFFLSNDFATIPRSSYRLCRRND